MAHEIIQPDGRAPAKGYANGVAAEGRMVFTGGMIGWTAEEVFETDDFAGQAEQALRLVQANGPVAGAFCAQSTTAILAQLDGFESIQRTFFPVNVMEQFATLPGVTTTKLFENDAGDVIDAVRAAELAQ